MDYFARAVLAVMNDAHVDKATLVGHSMGAPVICRVFHQAPERVAALVSVDGLLLHCAARIDGVTGTTSLAVVVILRKMLLAIEAGLRLYSGMAALKKLTRAEVYKQIDNFRGIADRGANGKPSVEQWVASKHAETSLPAQRAKPGKVMNHGWTRIKVG
jgi:pimeloyl-ACP methyl ester carboxylesterase